MIELGKALNKPIKVSNYTNTMDFYYISYIQGIINRDVYNNALSSDLF